MSDVKVTDSVLYVGCDDLDIDLFESQYHVPNGVSYNSYVILDEKIAIMDTVDPRRTEEWLEKVEKALGGRLPVTWLCSIWSRTTQEAFRKFVRNIHRCRLSAMQKYLA